MSSVLEILMDLGDPGRSREWRDYRSSGLGPEAESDLIAVLGDPALVWAEADSNESWAALHAWRSLGQLGSVNAIPALVALLADAEDDDWMMQDLPEVFGMIGPEAVPALCEHLIDATNGTFPRSIASEALVKVAEFHPEVRDECVRAQIAALEGFAEQDVVLNSLVAGDLVELHAVEAAPLLERAFEAKQIDIWHRGDWEDVQIALGLLEQRITPRQRASAFGGPLAFAEDGVEPPDPQQARKQAEAKKKVRSKQKRKAARQSRRRNRK